MSSHLQGANPCPLYPVAQNIMGKIKKRTLQQETEWWRKKCVTEAKRQVRQDHDFKCEYCGQGEPLKQTHGSHIYGEGTYKSMSADKDNILCLCATHHVGGYWKNNKEPSWHESPMEMTEWFRTNYPERHEELKRRIRTTTVCTLDYWKEKWEELKNGN